MKKSRASPPIALPRGLAGRIGYLLNRPALHIRERAHEILKPLGLIPPHFGVMSTLESEGPQTQRALGNLLRVDPTTMVWLIDHLEKTALVRRGKHPKDRRAYLVELSPTGQATYHKASKLLEAMDEEFLASLSKSEREDLRRLLTKLFKNIQSQGIPKNMFRNAHE